MTAYRHRYQSKPPLPASLALMSVPGNTRGRALAAAAVAALALAACNPFSAFAPTHEQVRAKGWLFPAQDRSPVFAIPRPGFCYQTLAGIDCYAEPVPGFQNQLVADPRILSAPAAYRR